MGYVAARYRRTGRARCWHGDRQFVREPFDIGGVTGRGRNTRHAPSTGDHDDDAIVERDDGSPRLDNNHAIFVIVDHRGYR